MPSPGKGNFQDDERLLRLLATDLDQHFAGLVSSYQKRLNVHVFYKLGNLHDAEEVVQDVFERAYYALKGYSEQRIQTLKLQSWLYTITKNICCNFLLKRSKVPHQSSLDISEEGSFLPEIEAACSEQPEMVSETNERVHEIEQVIQNLPDFCSEIVRLRFVECFSLQEIADILNLPIGTVKCYISRGTKLLREKLEEYDTIKP